MVTGDLPLVWADWLAVETEVLVAGELVGGRWPGALVMAARRPSGFVPYCTGWNNLNQKKMIMLALHFSAISKRPRISTSTMSCYLDFIADLMGFIGHGLGRGGGSGPVWISSMSC